MKRAGKNACRGAVTAPLPPAAAADMILWGGNVITMDPRKPAAEAVAVKDGRFLGIGEGQRGQGPGGAQNRDD